MFYFGCDLWWRLGAGETGDVLAQHGNSATCQNAFSRIILLGSRAAVCQLASNGTYSSHSVLHVDGTRQLPALPNTKQNNRHECAIYGKTCMWDNYVIVEVSFCLDLVDRRPFFFCLSSTVTLWSTFYGYVYEPTQVHLLFSHFVDYCEMVTEPKVTVFFPCFTKFEQMVRTNSSLKWRHH